MTTLPVQPTATDLATAFSGPTFRLDIAQAERATAVYLAKPDASIIDMGPIARLIRSQDAGDDNGTRADGIGNARPRA